MYKEIDLFGGETVRFAYKEISKRKSLFTDHDAFVEKFEAKKTTDDCYTPKPCFCKTLVMGSCFSGTQNLVK